MTRYDAIVLGLGAVGSAAAYQLAKRGKSVLGIDRFDPPHSMGSTHGETRITRAAIGEGVAFTPLAMRSNVLWRQIEWETGTNLFNQCGCLFIPSQQPGVTHGKSTREFFENIKTSVEKHGVRSKILAPGELKRDYPAFNAAETDIAFLDHEGGYLMVEKCVTAQLELARRHGATLLIKTPAKPVPSRSGVKVELQDGTIVEAEKMILATGSWTPDFVVPLTVARGVKVTRQVLHWFEIKSNPERFGPDAPVFIWLTQGRDGAKCDIYGFPYVGNPSNGVKIAREVKSDAVHPDTVSRGITKSEVDEMYEVYVRPFVPDLGRKETSLAKVCLYTETTDGRFIVDRHPDNENIIYASACSGHGFKHSAALGEALAELAMDRAPTHVDLSSFALSKLPRPQ